MLLLLLCQVCGQLLLMRLGGTWLLLALVRLRLIGTWLLLALVRLRLIGAWLLLAQVCLRLLLGLLLVRGGRCLPAGSGGRVGDLGRGIRNLRLPREPISNNGT